MNHAELKKSILDSIKRISIVGDWYEMSGEITRQTIQKAIDENDNVYIPNIGKAIVLDEPIVLSSNKHLKVDENQIIMQGKDSVTCLVRNASLQDGAFSITDRTKRDKNLSIEGGIWNIKKNQRCFPTKDKNVQGALGSIIFCGVEQVELKNMTIYDDPELCGIGNSSASYGIQICDCKDFVVENINFNNNSRDGVHINGPAEYGHVRHIRAKDMGDDMVAMNAWDWDTSAITFGTIQKVVVEDIKGTGNEFRLLPGQKLYKDGTKADCDIRDIVIEDLTGIYTFKLYAQPNISNAIIPGKHDVSGTVGTINNVFIKNVQFKKIASTGFNSIPVKGMFEICSDCTDLHIENASVESTLEQCDEKDVKFVSVGPLSAVWRNGSDNPDDWGEVFDPDAICHADDIYLKNICFNGVKVDDKEKLSRATKMTINEDYPNTVPKGGTGYGTLGKVHVE